MNVTVAHRPDIDVDSVVDKLFTLKRRVVAIGHNETLGITIPKNQAKLLGIERGDMLVVKVVGLQKNSRT